MGCVGKSVQWGPNSGFFPTLNRFPNWMRMVKRFRLKRKKWTDIFKKIDKYPSARLFGNWKEEGSVQR